MNNCRNNVYYAKANTRAMRPCSVDQKSGFRKGFSEDVEGELRSE